VCLPPSRTLAADLGVSRWTVTQAYAQLVTEGYLTARTGSATRVSWTPRPGLDEAADLPARPPEAVPDRPARFDLSSARPDLRAFPRRKWVEAIRAAAETAPFDQLDYAQSGGHPRLRAVRTDREIPVSPPALNQLTPALLWSRGPTTGIFARPAAGSGPAVAHW
jgi:GntR family transcriptional regulator / MocR family aminotransferase